MMVKCKIASESPCSKDCCCCDCPDVKRCEDACPTYVCWGKKVMNECDEIEIVETDVVALDKKAPEVIKAITDIVIQKKQLEEQEKIMREKLQIVMEQCNVKSFENESVRLTYIAPNERKSVDTTRLKKEHPEIAEKYQKVSQVKAQVKIEVKKNGNN